jgi:hypothetical protein
MPIDDFPAAKTTIRPVNPYPNTPAPVGAREVHDWVDLTAKHAHRYFVGRTFEVQRDDDRAVIPGPIEVFLNGIQYSDGLVEPVVTIVERSGNKPFERLNITPGEARRLARMLIAAAAHDD